VCGELLDCLKKHSCNAQFCVDYVYDCMVNALSASAKAWVPRTKPGFYKVWWNDTLTKLKTRESVEAHDLWKICGRPKQGDVFMRMKCAKIKVKGPNIALNERTHLRATERHLSYGITQCYLPPDRGECALP